jgi:hypothetical protein
MKYLTNEQLRANLSLGKTIEQWLSFESKNDYVILKWLSINKDRDLQYAVNYHECFDDGSEDFFDIYEFDPLDPDEPYVLDNFETVDRALEFAISKYNASPTKFITGGMIEEEYKNYTLNKFSSNK